MGFLDRLFGREEKHDRREARERSGDYGEPRRMSDEQAVERYKYLLRTAPPEAIEQAHEEAFAKLSPEQRRMVLDQLSQEAPASERVKDPNDTRALARMATRAEMRRPGTLERTFGGVGGVGIGGFIAGGLLSSIAGAFIGTAIADAVFDNDAGFSEGDYSDQMAADDSYAQDTDMGGQDGGGADFGGDFDSGDTGGGDF